MVPKKHIPLPHVVTYLAASPRSRALLQVPVGLPLDIKSTFYWQDYLSRTLLPLSLAPSLGWLKLLFSMPSVHRLTTTPVASQTLCAPNQGMRINIEDKNDTAMNIATIAPLPFRPILAADPASASVGPNIVTPVFATHTPERATHPAGGGGFSYWPIAKPIAEMASGVRVITRLG